MSLSIKHNLLHDRTDLLSPSLILNDLTSPSLPTCISIMRAKVGKDFGMFLFLINTISVITKFLWNMKYIAVAFVATVNKNTVSMGKTVFALKYKVILANLAFPEIKWFLWDSFSKKNLNLMLEVVRWDFRKKGFLRIEFARWI